MTVILHDPDEAEDVAQSAFARPLDRRSRFRGGDVRAWLYTIGIRLALNELPADSVRSPRFPPRTP